MDKKSSSGILRVASPSDTRPLADRLEPVPDGIMPVVSMIGKRFYQNIDSIGSFRLHTRVCDDAHVLGNDLHGHASCHVAMHVSSTAEHSLLEVLHAC